MAIPTKFDHDRAHIDNLHSCIMIKLRTFQTGGMVCTPEGSYERPAHVTPEMRSHLRDMLQEYVNAVFAMVPKPAVVEEPPAKPAKRAKAR